MSAETAPTMESDIMSFSGKRNNFADDIGKIPYKNIFIFFQKSIDILCRNMLICVDTKNYGRSFLWKTKMKKL